MNIVKKTSIALLSGTAIVLCSNILHAMWSVTPRGFVLEVYNYQSLNSDFAFTCVPSKGRRIELMQGAKSRFDAERNVDTNICRTFSINYFKFWKWHEYMTNPYYQFPLCPEK